MYYIYHVPGEKIGVSKRPAKRVKMQDFSDYEILEEHTCIYTVSDREIELQKEYGYKVDNIPYWKTIENSRSNFTVEESRKGGLKNKEKPGYFKELSKLSPRTQFKLSKEQQEEVRVRRSNGESATSLGKEFNVTRQTIWSICKKKGHSEE